MRYAEEVIGDAERGHFLRNGIVRVVIKIAFDTDLGAGVVAVGVGGYSPEIDKVDRDMDAALLLFVNVIEKMSSNLSRR